MIVNISVIILPILSLYVLVNNLLPPLSDLITARFPPLQMNPETFLSPNRKSTLLQPQRHLRFLRHFKRERGQQAVKDRFRLHQSESRAYASPLAHTKWQIRVRINTLPVLHAKPFRVELFRLWVVFRVSLNGKNRNPQHVAHLKVVRPSIDIQFVRHRAYAICRDGRWPFAECFWRTNRDSNLILKGSHPKNNILT